MAIYVMADNNQSIPASRDGAMYNAFAGGKDFIIDGIGDEFALTYTASSLNVTLGTGEAVICGRHVAEVAENGITTNLRLEADTAGWIVLRIDLTMPAGTEGSLRAVNTIVQQNINANGTIHDLPLYQYATGSDGITSISDVREVQTSAGGGNAHSVTLIASAWVDKNYTISNDRISPNKVIMLTYPAGITDAQYNALGNASIRTTAVAQGSLTLKALGNVPTVDIPIQLVIWG